MMKGQKINRADLYRAQPDKQKWRKDGLPAGRAHAALVKEYEPIFDQAQQRYRGDQEITICVRAFRSSASMRMRFTETVQWLDGLTDSDFDIPQMADFNAVCQQYNKRLYACNLPSHVGEMKKIIGRLESRVATLRKAEKRQGVTFAETEIAFPLREPTSEAAITSEFDARRPIGG